MECHPLWLHDWRVSGRAECVRMRLARFLLSFGADVCFAQVARDLRSGLQ